MIKIDDIIESSSEVRRVIDVTDDVVVAVLIADINGLVDQAEDNIGDFILLSDIRELSETE